ncbi:hypothetical protein GCM10008112_06430 [Flexivirga endophytica]|nr:hypothetical protein GCM10008112_06430 [Flexivirga endophytica]
MAAVLDVGHVQQATARRAAGVPAISATVPSAPTRPVKTEGVPTRTVRTRRPGGPTCVGAVVVRNVPRIGSDHDGTTVERPPDGAMPTVVDSAGTTAGARRVATADHVTSVAATSGLDGTIAVPAPVRVAATDRATAVGRVKLTVGTVAGAAVRTVTGVPLGPAMVRSVAGVIARSAAAVIGGTTGVMTGGMSVRRLETVRRGGRAPGTVPRRRIAPIVTHG